MPEQSNNPFNLWNELKRRKVPSVLAIYAGTAFVILEAVDIIFPRWGFPDWTIDLVLYLLIIGAVVTIILSWIYDFTPQGVIKTGPVESTIMKDSTSVKAYKRLRISNIIIAVLIIVVGMMLYPKLFKGNTSPLSGTQRSSIAVLPFKIIGDQPDLNFLASGLVETLTYMLTKIGNSQQIFSVIPASEVVESITASEARKRFGVTMVISGSIQMEGNTGRVILNLINTKKQQLLQSEKFDYKKENNFILQDEAIKVIVDMLGLDIGSLIDNQFVKSGSVSFEANELYLIGKGILREGVEVVQDIDTAIDLFKLAIKKDSTFALAYSGIASANIIKYHFTDNIEFTDEALNYSLKALEMNERDADILITYANALVEKKEYNEADSIYQLSRGLDSLNPRLFRNLGYFYDIQGKSEFAEENYIKAIQLNPRDYTAIYELAAFYYTQNRFEDAIIEMSRALELAPGHLTMLYGLGVCYFGIDNLDEALKTFEKINGIDSTQAHIIRNLASCYYYKGDYKQASYYYNRAIKYNPEDYALHGFLGRACYLLGDHENANAAFRKAISQVLKHPDHTYYRSIATYYGLMGMTDSSYYYLDKCDLTENPSDHSPAIAYLYGELFLILGENDKALIYLESALERGYGWMEVKYSPFLKDLKNDPDFKAMIANCEQ